jgi:hypothetical protein
MQLLLLIILIVSYRYMFRALLLLIIFIVSYRYMFRALLLLIIIIVSYRDMFRASGPSSSDLYSYHEIIELYNGSVVLDLFLVFLPAMQYSLFHS